ncbi:MAG: DUF3267 domain-containing protein [Clostridia bacterium]|nr:DUF3267 domain-containing protein [Clostridia bacterium]
MIRLKCSIDDINRYQTGILPENAEKIDTPKSIEEMMKKALPIAVVMCVVLVLTMFIKTHISHRVVISPIAFLAGFIIGFALLIMHEWLHAVVYPKKANITIGKINGKMTFVALVSYPLKRSRFIVMCLLPFVLGIVPLAIFIVNSAEKIVLNGLMFGMSCMGMVSPFPDVYNVITVLMKADKKDSIMFYKDDIYKIS